MKKSGILMVMALISMVAIFPWGGNPAFGNTARQAEPFMLIARPA